MQALAWTGAGLVSDTLAATAPPVPIIDTHIHLFDPRRAGGIPWPLADDPVVYRPALPGRYQQQVKGLGVVGAIVIEASPRPQDNDWLLEQLAQAPIMLGMIGDLIPDHPTFQAELDRLRTNSLFLGIRYGNLWERDLTLDIKKPGFLSGVRCLADAGLVFESANPTPALVHCLADLAESLPTLTIIVDHLPHMALPDAGAERSALLGSMSRLAASARVYVKLSEIPMEQSGTISRKVETYRAILDRLTNMFGEDKILFGSDWPNSDHLLKYGETLDIVKAYAAMKTKAAQAKLFWKNSIAAYRWKPRTPAQQRLVTRLRDPQCRVKQRGQAVYWLFICNSVTGPIRPDGSSGESAL